MLFRSATTVAVSSASVRRSCNAATGVSSATRAAASSVDVAPSAASRASRNAISNVTSSARRCRNSRQWKLVRHRRSRASKDSDMTAKAAAVVVAADAAIVLSRAMVKRLLPLHQA